MAYVASLDMGSETMVMALGEQDREEIHLIGVELAPSQGVVRGRMADKFQVKKVIQHLLETFRNNYGIQIDTLQVALPGTWLKQVSDRENHTFSKPREVKVSHLEDLKDRCSNMSAKSALVAVLPVAYFLDGEEQAYPVGKTARHLEACFQVYVAKESELAEFRALLKGVGVEEVSFFPAAEALSKALIPGRSKNTSFAIVDMGAESTKVVVVEKDRMVYDVELSLGGSSVDMDLNTAFSIRDMAKAQRLKHEFGMALRAESKNQKVIIPDTHSSIERKDLVLVEQSRLEELLEGAIFQIQQSGYYEELSSIFLTGGGSRTQGITTLMAKLSGCEVKEAVAAGVTAKTATDVQVPEFLTALGLLHCGVKEKMRVERPIQRWFKGLFKEGEENEK